VVRNSDAQAICQQRKYIICMSRPVGVTASAIVAILGSIFVLLLAALSVASLFIATAQPQPPNSPQFVMAGAAMFTALAVFGIWTSVGIFRLRSWARTSILVFAGFLAAGSIFGLLGTMAMPTPPAMTAGTEQIFRRVIVVMFGLPFAVAVWWLVQFNTQSTKAAFASPIAEAPSSRPLSITIIAWASIFGGASCVFAILARVPAFLFGRLSVVGPRASFTPSLERYRCSSERVCSICERRLGFWQSGGSGSRLFMRALSCSCRLCGSECSSCSDRSLKTREPLLRSIKARSLT
jgi:hypothetical protein